MDISNGAYEWWMFAATAAGALASACAAIVAVVLANRDRTDRIKAEGQLEALRKRERMAAAASVSFDLRMAGASLVEDTDDIPRELTFLNSRGKRVARRYAMRVANLGDMPIRHLHVTITDVAAPGGSPRSIDLCPLLEPRQSFTWNFPIGAGGRTGSATLYFADAFGQAWSLTHEGLLEEAPATAGKRVAGWADQLLPQYIPPTR